MSDEELHALARDRAAGLSEPDKKQLRFNEIVSTARQFYADPAEGVRDLVRSCSKEDAAYVKGRPMWRVLGEEYAWMLG